MLSIVTRTCSDYVCVMCMHRELPALPVGDDKPIQPLKMLQCPRPARVNSSKHIKFHILSYQRRQTSNFMYGSWGKNLAFVIVPKAWPIREGKMLYATIIVLCEHKGASLSCAVHRSTCTWSLWEFLPGDIMRRQSAKNVNSHLSVDLRS